MKIEYIDVRLEPFQYLTQRDNVLKALRIIVKPMGGQTENFLEVVPESDTMDTFSYMMERAAQIIKERLNEHEKGTP